MNRLKLTGPLLCLLTVVSCSDNSGIESTATAKVPEPQPAVMQVATDPADGEAAIRSRVFDRLRQKIIYGSATLAEVREALTENDPFALTNTVHALYSMRWHRGVFKLLYEMWEKKHDKYPEINWQQIEQPPVRLALASTLNRIQISDTKVFQDYLRSFRDHAHEFTRAQVVVGLGFNGDPADIPYLRAMIEAENDYVAQSAITGLGLMSNNEARDSLIDLRKNFKGKPRLAIIDAVLRDGYRLVPAMQDPDSG